MSSQKVEIFEKKLSLGVRSPCKGHDNFKWKQKSQKAMKFEQQCIIELVVVALVLCGDCSYSKADL